MDVFTENTDMRGRRLGTRPSSSSSFNSTPGPSRMCACTTRCDRARPSPSRRCRFRPATRAVWHDQRAGARHRRRLPGRAGLPQRQPARRAHARLVVDQQHAAGRRLRHRDPRPGRVRERERGPRGDIRARERCAHPVYSYTGPTTTEQLVDKSQFSNFHGSMDQDQGIYLRFKMGSTNSTLATSS